MFLQVSDPVWGALEELIAQLCGWEDMAFIAPQRTNGASSAQQLRGQSTAAATWVYISPANTEQIKTRVQWY